MAEPELRVTWHSQSPAELLVQAGEWLEVREDFTGAATYYSAALRLDPECGLAAWRSGQLTLRREDWSSAAEAFEEAVRITPDHAPGYYQLSVAYGRLERWEDAGRAAEGCLALDPAHPGALMQKARALAALGRWPELRSHVTQRSSFPPELGELVLWHALALANDGEPARAAELMRDAPPRLRRRCAGLVRRIEASIGTGDG